MLKNPSFIFDIVCTAVWLILLWWYSRKGFLACIVRLFGNLLSLWGAREFAQRVSAWAFDNFMAANFHAKVVETISTGEFIQLDSIAEKYAGFLPKSFRESIVETCERGVTVALRNNAEAFADTIVQNIIRPLLTPVLALALFFVGYALLRMILSMLGTVLGLVNKLPVIGAVNRWLGLAVGGLASIVDIYLVLCVVWAVIVVTGGSLTALNDEVMSASVYYKIFNLFNPFI